MSAQDNLSQQQRLVTFNPRTMGSYPNPLSKHMLTPNASEAPDWDTHYGKAFKWGYVPKENQILGKGEKHDPNQIGLIAPISPSFYQWKDASDHPDVQKMKANWSEHWKTIPRYKQNQINASVRALGK